MSLLSFSPLLASASLTDTLLELTALFAICLGIGVAAQRVKMPTIVGFLLAGALIGPHGLALVRRPELVEQLADLGVMMLLFTVGTELSLTRLAHLRRAIVLGGGLQIGLTIALGAAVAHVAGMEWNRAIFLGFLLAMSSTAAITKLLSDRGELHAPASRLAVAICVAQDLAVVPLLLLLPILGHTGGGPGIALLETGKALGLLALVALAGRILIPRALDRVARTRNRELFVLAVIVQCLAMSLATGALGLSMALGSFLSGLIIGSSDHHHQATSEVEPFRDALASLFFVSIGMLFDCRTIVEAPIFLTISLGAVIVGKAALAALATRALGMPTWTSARAGLMLAQVGEFSFVLAQTASEHALLSERARRVFLVVAVASIALTPALFAVGRRLGRSHGSTRRAAEEETQHVAVIGYGPTGQGLIRSLRALGIPVRAIEMNPDSVARAKREGVAMVQGDATRTSVLEAVGIRQARLLVVATNDPDATTRAVALARKIAPRLHILVRTNYLADIPRLEGLGADEIVPQELETSVELTARALRHFLVPDDEIARAVGAIRAAAYEARRIAPTTHGTTARLSQYVPGLMVLTFKVEDGSAIAGKTLGESHLRRDTGLSVVALRRAGDTDVGIGPETRLEPGDVVVGIGGDGARESAAPRFRGPLSAGAFPAEPLPPSTPPASPSPAGSERPAPAAEQP